ncbi:MAG: YncE family protein, partial [Actinomycetota bacterium]|nr:YncE family protein [Actinomycetota bacterium]
MTETRPRAAARRSSVFAAMVATLGLLGGCSAQPSAPAITSPTSSATTGSAANQPGPTATAGTTATAAADPSAAQGPYAHTGAGDLSAQARRAKPLVYVPNQRAGTVQVIDPKTYQVVATYPVGRSPEHVVPSHDLRTLWVNSDAGNSMTPIDPRTGKPGKTISVNDPYNLYFTPDGRYALVMAEALRRIDVRDAHTMNLVRSLPIPCAGINHADFTADLSTLLVSCEFSGKLALVDADATRVISMINLNTIKTPGATDPAMARSMGGPAGGLARGANAMPQDVRLSPDGKWFLVADMLRNGLWVIDAHTLKYSRFVPTGKGAHGIYPSRDASRIYVSNRDEGSISVLDGATLAPVAKWKIPGGGSPDMGGVTADGTELWLTGRYNSVVYVFNTSSGKVTHRIAVRPGPHGLLVWPQPGRYS